MLLTIAKTEMVHTSQGIIEFIPHESSLLYLDLKDKEQEGTILVTTVREDFEGYTKKQVKGLSRHAISSYAWISLKKRL